MNAQPAASMLLCRVGGHGVALPAAEVIEVMRRLPVRPLASVNPIIEGAALIRGLAVPVLSLSRLLDPSGQEPSARFVAVRSGGRVVALAVSEVIGLQRVSSSQLAALPPLLGAADASSIAGLEVLDRELWVILSCSRLLRAEDWAGLALESA